MCQSPKNHDSLRSEQPQEAARHIEQMDLAWAAFHTTPLYSVSKDEDLEGTPV
eukprot:CAMPEP_0206507872 /NCGR_PEP_ID=MMETSP0324_2-20121206/57870_1 /ASSEMBLY_ACC=CAM_ASM_000836 /TAXON_ID=2866 /ORGANISM="Crypthecodinium cohnii, Strain Seligo" /LENGTH=52 /DNA_ID=CAMNT_0053998377 /DNA_START=124 /DNA_END=280 /DNA_ORIENTATION=-